MSGLSLRLFVSVLVIFCFVLPASAAEPIIKLLDAGTGAKQELRITPTVGSTESFQMLLDMNMGMDMGGGGRNTDVPPVKMVLKGTVAEVSPSGNIRYDFELTESALLKSNSTIDVSAEKQAELDALAAQVRPELAKLVGTSGDVVISNRGILQSTTVKPPEGVKGKQFGNMQKALSHASAAFPVEPVGVGAKWTVEQMVEESGLDLKQVTTYTVKSLSGRTVELEMQLEQTAEADALTMSNLPEGTTANLVALASKGGGTSTLQLDKLFPTSGTIQHGLESRVLVGKGGQGMHIGMTMQLDLGLKRL